MGRWSLLFSRPVVAALVLTAGTASTAWPQGVNLFPPPSAPDTGEREMKALHQAYPDRISQAAQRDGDWAVEMDGQWFYWAHGRILAESLRQDWASYGSYRFYRYAVGVLPPLPQLDAQAVERLQKALAEARAHPPRRAEQFLERLFAASSAAQTSRQIVTTDFMGFSVRVHPRIVEALSEVAAELEALRRSDPGVTAFFAGLSEIDGFNYRDVAGTLTRSYHGYGLALDMIPRTYGGKAAYWRWLPGSVEQWWATPYERRWMIPLPIVTAFEHHGFVWGGKWLFFDTMHFEYRPEILVLAQEQAGG